MYQHDPDAGKQAPWKTALSATVEHTHIPCGVPQNIKESRKVDMAHNVPSCKVSAHPQAPPRKTHGTQPQVWRNQPDFCQREAVIYGYRGVIMGRSGW